MIEYIYIINSFKNTNIVIIFYKSQTNSITTLILGGGSTVNAKRKVHLCMD